MSMKRKQIIAWIVKTILITLSLTFRYRYIDKPKVYEYLQEQQRDGILLYFKKFGFYFNNDKIYVALVAFAVGCLVYLVETKIRSKKKENFVTPLLSVLFAISLLIGVSFNRFGSLQLFYSGGINLLIALIAGVGFYLISDLGIRTLFYAMDWIREHRILVREEGIITGRMERQLSKRPFIFSFFVMIICWLPYWMILFPGTISYDGYTQISQFMGYVPLSTHHPPFMTALMGSVVWIGRKLGSDNLGLCLYVTIQYLLQAAGFAYAVKILDHMKISYRIEKYFLLYMALFPMYPLNAMNLNKDSLFAVVFLLFVLSVVQRILRRNESYTIKQIIADFVIMALMILMRNNGIHILLVTLPFMILAVTKQNRKQWIGLLILALLFSQGLSKIVYPALGFHKGSVVEAMSVPMQQVARNVKYHPEDISKKDEQRIRRILHYDTLAQDYDPNLSDPIKSYVSYSVMGATKNITSEDVKEFMTAWIHGLKDHPLTYIEATLANTDNYYSLNTQDDLGYEGQYRISRLNKMIVKYKFESHEKLMKIADCVEGFWEIGKNLPLFGLLFSTGTYTWIALLMMGYQLRHKQYRNLVIYLPFIAVVLSCMLGPQNGNARYVRPVMLTIWITVILGILYQKDQKS